MPHRAVLHTCVLLLKCPQWKTLLLPAWCFIIPPPSPLSQGQVHAWCASCGRQQRRARPHVSAPAGHWLDGGGQRSQERTSRVHRRVLLRHGTCSSPVSVFLALCVCIGTSCSSDVDVCSYVGITSWVFLLRVVGCPCVRSCVGWEGALVDGKGVGALEGRANGGLCVATPPPPTSCPYCQHQIISGQSLKAGPQSSASMDAWAAMGRHPSFQRTVLGPELARPLDLLAKGYGQYVGTKATAKPASAFTWLRVKVCMCALFDTSRCACGCVACCCCCCCCCLELS